MGAALKRQPGLPLLLLLGGRSSSWAAFFLLPGGASSRFRFRLPAGFFLFRPPADACLVVRFGRFPVL